MNERIKQLAEKARIKDHWSIDEGRYLTNYLDEQKFAELIVGECIDIANGTRYDGKVVANRIKFVFGIEEHRGWVCSKCGTDRTREACPLGHTAAIEGRCPMTAEAQ